MNLFSKLFRKVALLVTPLLTLVTQNININSEINVSYVVALHWWMTICIFFVFMSLIEFAVAISWAWRANDRKAARATQVLLLTNSYQQFFLTEIFLIWRVWLKSRKLLDMWMIAGFIYAVALLGTFSSMCSEILIILKTHWVETKSITPQELYFQWLTCFLS